MKFPPRSKIYLIIVLLITFFIVLNLTGLTKEIKNFFYLISSPIQKTLWRAGDNISDFWGGIFEIKSLKKEVQILQLERQELLSQIVSLKELEKENKTLRTALNIGLEKDFQLKLSQVVSKDTSKDSILIDKGLKEGILKGFPVITSQKTLLGRIGEVYRDFSEVILISNKESSFNAKISEKEIYGVVKGKGNLELYLDLIPKDKELFKGEFVITTTLGKIFPKGILIGSIKEIKKSDIEPFQTAEIKPGFDLKKLDSLFVIINF